MNGEYYAETQDTIKRLSHELRDAHGLAMRLHSENDTLTNRNNVQAESIRSLRADASRMQEELNAIIRKKWDIESERDKLRAAHAHLNRLLNTHSDGCDVFANGPDSITKPCNCHVHLSAALAQLRLDSSAAKNAARVRIEQLKARITRMELVVDCAQRYVEAVDLVSRNEAETMLISETPGIAPTLDALTMEADMNLSEARRRLVELQSAVSQIALGER